MDKFIEYIKKFPRIKKIGKRILMLKECCHTIVADEDFYRDYQKKFLELPNCRDGAASLEDLYLKGNLRLLKRPLQAYYDELWEVIVEKIIKKESYAIIRVGDGEANFLRGIVKGNTATRHFTKKGRPDSSYLEQFKNGLLKCDSIHVEMNKNRGSAFRKMYGCNIFSPIPLECIYALVASGKLSKSKYRIGIIGADNKIEVIKKLFEHQEYRDYLGRSSFEHYISIPEKGSSNDVDKLFDLISGQLNNEIDIYLVGIGISKMAVLSRFKERSNAVFIDVGCGVSAYAGLTSNERPYFADWVNFRLKNIDYSKIDVMDSDMGKGGKVFL